MKIKNPNQFSRWQFFCQAPNGDELKLPIDRDYAGNFQQLYNIVLKQFDSFGKDYKAAVEINAAKVNMTYSPYIKKCIEHQICLRGGPALCWEDGFGDTLHTIAATLDDIVDASPAPIRRLGRTVTKAMTKLATGKSAPKFSNCATCGGTRSFMAREQNLGRAGKVNSIVPRLRTSKRA